MRIKDKLSPVYDHLLAESFLTMDVPEESFSDCDNCHFCTKQSLPKFSSKCCDYHPFIPNYMVGAILSDETEELKEGKKRILKRIKDKIGVTPYGIQSSLPYTKLFKENRAKKRKKETVTRAEIDAITCPYLDHGKCTVYKYRSDLCPVWYCTSTSGKVGNQFWEKIKQYTFAVEKSLRIHVMMELGYPIEKIHLPNHGPTGLQLQRPDGSLRDKAFKKLWDKWLGKEEDFYKDSFSVVMGMDKDKVDKTLGSEQTIIMAQLEGLVPQMHAQRLPDLLVLEKDNVQWQKLSAGEPIIMNGNQLKLGKLQLMMLKSFDGQRTTKEVFRNSVLNEVPVLQIVKPLMEMGVLKEG